MTHPLYPSRCIFAYKWLVASVFLLCMLAYLRGLFGGFLLDDFGSIVDNPSLRLLDGTPFRWIALAVSSPAGVLRRPISMLSFGADFMTFGLNPIAFKATNLAIHLLNGALLYNLGRHLVKRLIAPFSEHGVEQEISSQAIALLASALWLLHPLNVSGVIYIVQRMNLLASLFTLAGLACYTAGRERMLAGNRGALIALGGVCLFGILAVLSKENGVLIFAYALVIEALCFHFSAQTQSQRNLIKIFFWLTVALPVAICIGWLATHPHWLAERYANRDFSLLQRLLSEPRILCDYLVWILIPNPSWMGLYHDGVAVSTGLITPWTTLPAIAFLTVIAVFAWKWRRDYPAIAFGVMWFMVGHSMESTFLPLELVFEHRNYLPMAGLLFGLVCIGAPWAVAKLGRRYAAVACGVLVLTYTGLTAVRANVWGDPLRLAISEATNHPDSVRAQYNAGRTILVTGIASNRRDEGERDAMPYFERGKALDATDMFCAQSLILIHGRHSGNGQVPAEAIADMARRAREVRLPQINPLLVILTAATDGRLNLTPEQMESLVGAVMENSHYQPTERAMVLSDYGHWQFQVLHHNQTAVSLTLAAAAEDPKNPLFQINLAKLALALGEQGKAAEHIELAQKLNISGIYDSAITDLRQRLKAPNG